VSAIVVENGRLALRSQGRDFPSRDTLHRLLGDAVTLSRRDIWLKMSDGWQGQLVRLLEALGSVATGA
jgi:hypothetical protein